MTSIPLSPNSQLFYLLLMMLICCSLLCTPSQAELSTNDFSLSIDTHKHNDIQVDEIDTIINSQEFTVIEDKGFPLKGNPWFKVQWDKRKITDEKFIINDFTPQAYESFYFIKDNKVLSSYSYGSRKNFDEHLIKHFKFVANVSEIDYLLVKSCCDPSVPIYFRLLNKQEFNEQYYQGLIWYSVVYSIIIMMVVYNLFIYLYLREKQYLMYCYYLISMLMLLVSLSGIGQHYFWPNLSYVRDVHFIISINCTIASMLFQLAFLEKKYLTSFNEKLMYRTIYLQIFVICVYFLGSLFFHYSSVIILLLLQLVAILSLVVTDYVIIRNIIAGDKTARILLFGYLLINAATVVIVGRNAGYVSNMLWVERIGDIALLCEALILSLALAQKIQVLRVQKSLAEEKRLQDQQQFSKQLLQVQEEEKKQLGSALHDNFTHELLILKTNITKNLGIQSQESKHVDKILNEIRDLSHLVHPYLLEKLGLKEALAGMLDKIADTYDIDINFASDGVILNEDQSIIIYRIIQESLNNIIKYANASECLVAIKQNQQQVEVIIKDDGDGFKTESIKGLGISTIEKRCQMLSGELIIDSNEYGTILKVIFPNSSV